MHRLTVSVLALILVASPALAQFGGGPGGGGPGGGGPGGGRGGIQGGGAPTDDDSDSGSSDKIGSHDHPHEMKPISRELFDKVATAMFNQADLNHDGMVTLAELDSVIATRRDAVIRARFAEIDANHNGTIDLTEFVAWEQKMGSAAASSCSVYAGHLEMVPETLGPALSDSERNEALGFAIEPLSATMLTKANVHYRPGATLDDVLAYENARFDAADTNHDGFLVQQELAAWRHAAREAAGRSGGRNPREETLDN